MRGQVLDVGALVAGAEHLAAGLALVPLTVLQLHPVGPGTQYVKLTS